MVKWLKKIYDSIKYSFFFGMKAVNDSITVQNTSNDVGVVKTQEQKNLGESLLKGELTQQVQEFRYSNYEVLKKSNDYVYIGDGKVVKTKERKPSSHFYQNNSLICEGVGHELERVGKYSTERYTFEFIYKDVTRFKLEAYANYGEFIIDKGNAITVRLHFDKTIRNRYDSISYAIIKELEKISKFTSIYEIERNDICTNVKMMSFVTYRPKDEEDLIRYTINDLIFSNCREYDDAFVLEYVSYKFTREDLTKKFYSESMAEKYKNKEQKEVKFGISDAVEKYYCEVCGEEMNEYDAKIVEQTYGKKICAKCLKKLLTNEQ